MGLPISKCVVISNFCVIHTRSKLIFETLRHPSDDRSMRLEHALGREIVQQAKTDIQTLNDFKAHEVNTTLYEQDSSFLSPAMFILEE